MLIINFVMFFFFFYPLVHLGRLIPWGVVD